MTALDVVIVLVAKVDGAPVMVVVLDAGVLNYDDNYLSW